MVIILLKTNYSNFRGDTPKRSIRLDVFSFEFRNSYRFLTQTRSIAGIFIIDGDIAILTAYNRNNHAMRSVSILFSTDNAVLFIVEHCKNSSC